MSSLAVAFVWCVVQVSLIAAVAAALYALARRMGPAARSLAALAGLGLIVVLTALALSPWPRWQLGGSPDVRGRDASAAEGHSAAQPAAPDRGVAEDVAAGRNPRDSIRASVPPESEASAAVFFQAFLAELQRAPPETGTSSWRWMEALAGLFVLCASLGLLRLGAGLAAVRSYRLNARPVVDTELRELADVLQAELKCPRPVTLCESDRLATAATIGWRRPLVILPDGWREWTLDERRMVLAHEIAHIARHDFLTWAAAQLAVAFHFYHPLVHWLAARLRLEQELAADAEAAALSGGARAYLTTLAGMALRQSDHSVPWPARTFLPTRGTFMRRIEMLRDETRLSTRLSPAVRIGMLGVLAAAGLAVAGLRGSAEDQTSKDELSNSIGSAEEGSPDARDNAIKRARLSRSGSGSGSGSGGASSESFSRGGSSGSSSSGSGSGSSNTGGAGSSQTSTTGNEPFSLAYVPRDAAAVAAIRPAALLGRPALAGVRKAVAELKDLEQSLGVSPERIEQATIILMMDPGEPGQGRGRSGRGAGPVPAGFILKLLAPVDAQAVVKALQPAPQEQEYDGKKYLRGREFTFAADDRTVIQCEHEEYLRRIIVAGKSGAAGAKWAGAWNRIARSDVAALISTPTFHETLKRETNGPLAAFAPLWSDTSSALLSADFGERLKVALALNVVDPKSAQKVRDTLAAAMTLGQNSLSEARADVSRQADATGPVLLRMLDALDAALDSTRIEQSDEQVRATAELGGDEGASIIALLAPAIQSSRTAARQSQSKNNLKQLALAMHNYHDAHQHFPPAVLYGPDGKTAYSWRVALLPYLDADALYRQYRLDEPWDSDNNKQVLAQMPAIFRDPTDPAGSTFTSYFRLSGTSKRAPEREKDGWRMADILDGTSNTIMFVEAKRDVPWTKPEDIPCAADKPLPKFGGHFPGLFLAVFFDGAARLISQNIDPSTLRALITPDAGEPVDLSAVNRAIQGTTPPRK